MTDLELAMQSYGAALSTFQNSRNYTKDVFHMISLWFRNSSGNLTYYYAQLKQVLIKTGVDGENVWFVEDHHPSQPTMILMYEVMLAGDGFINYFSALTNGTIYISLIRR